jgi:Tfp pilus assembly protein FimV
MLGLVLMVGLALINVVPVGALSVGNIDVKSRRGAPFLAEIPLTVGQRERQQGITVALGNRQDYQEEGLPRAELIDRLAVTWLKEPRDALRITSQEPVSEAAFHLVLLVHSGQVTIVQTYQVELPAAPSPPQVMARQEATRTPPALKPEPPSISETLRIWQQGLPPRYGPVEKGKTLYSVVVQLGVPTGVIWQAVVRIWQANQPQFSGGNLHGLQSGSFLLLPPDLAEGIAAMTIKEARDIIAQQWDKWQTLRGTLQGRQSVVPARHTSIALAQNHVLLPSQPEPVAIVEATPVPRASPLSVATVVLPTELQPTTQLAGDLRLVFRGLEEFLAQRLPELEGRDQAPTSVSVVELQTALQGLEERLMQRFQTSIQQVSITPQPPTSPTPTLLEQMLPSSSMVHVLVLENSLLLLIAVGVVWRWYRSR